MSQENAETVRKAWEAAWSKPPDWAALGALYHPDLGLREALEAVGLRE